MNRYYIIILVLTGILSGCETNAPTSNSKIRTGIVSEITQTNANLHASFQFDISAYQNVMFGFLISESNSDITSHTGKYLYAKKVLENKYVVNVSNLTPATKYYYCAIILLNDIQYEFGEVKDFTTQEQELAQVSTSDAYNISYTSATIEGNILNNGGADILEYGIVYGTSPNPTLDNNKIKLQYTEDSFSCKLIGLLDGTMYYARAYATTISGTGYGQEVEFRTNSYPTNGGYRYVDLGLSVKWAIHNIGAEQPEDFGHYFAWGETYSKTIYDYSTYIFAEDINPYLPHQCTNFTKYNTENYSWAGYVDNKTKLDLVDDAACIHWGGTWRMPTYNDIKELCNKCTWTKTQVNNISGYTIIGPNGNSIFLPQAGCYNSEFHYDTSTCIWSSTLFYPFNAYCITDSELNWAERMIGYPIRPCFQ